jgi:glucose-6-phosphate isomerase
VSGSLGAQFLVWEYATAVAGRLLGINPFDQPDVEAAKIAARGLLDARPEPTAPAFVADGIEVRGSESVVAGASTLEAAVSALLAELGPDGYVSIHAYVDRVALPQLAGIRDLLAAKSKRPVTFGWGPRFLHSTGQFHKGGPRTGRFLQLIDVPASDLEVPGEPFTFGTLVRAQADGDLQTLRDHGLPAVRVVVGDIDQIKERL